MDKPTPTFSDEPEKGGRPYEVPSEKDRADWHALRDLRRSQVPEVLKARAAARNMRVGELRKRLIHHYGKEAELLPAPKTGRPKGSRTKVVQEREVADG